MTTYTKTLTVSIMFALILGATHWVSAMKQVSFQDTFIQWVQLSESLDQSELALLNSAMKNISKQDIIQALESEISDISDRDFQKRVQKSFNDLVNITDDQDFSQALQDIYNTLDSYYFSGNNNSELPQFLSDDSKESKDFILSALTSEVSHISDKNLQTSISNTISKLQQEENDLVFYEQLDDAYNTLNSYYESKTSIFTTVTWEDGTQTLEELTDYNFSEVKTEILKGIREEMEKSKDAKDRARLDMVIEKLEKENNEKEFFDILGELYFAPQADAFFGGKQTGSGTFSSEVIFPTNRGLSQ